MADTDRDLIHLIRLSLEGRIPDVTSLGRRLLRSVSRRRPELSNEIAEVLSLAARPHALRSASPHPVPVDLDSKLELVRRDYDPRPEVEPVWPDELQRDLSSVVDERAREADLVALGLAPTRSMLLVGPPGTGKTLAAKWLASQLLRALLTLDLAAVMSSYLGRTGNNIRTVLDFARQDSCVLLLDEFDAIAKRRDDGSEVGELKRLVTVLLQSVDDWPVHGLLICATNHPELLDPAIWRRFDRVIHFRCPSSDEIERLLPNLLPPQCVSTPEDVVVLAALLAGQSYSDITRSVRKAVVEAVVRSQPLTSVYSSLLMSLCAGSSLETKIAAASRLSERGLSQRTVSSITGLSRDTLRKRSGLPSHSRPTDEA